MREEADIEARQQALDEQEKAEGIMRMPPMPGTEPAEKDKRNPGSPWFVERQQRLRILRQREKVSCLPHDGHLKLQNVDD